jgi:hypothetical protein
MGRTHSAYVDCLRYTILVVKPQRKRQLGRPSCRWEDTIEVGLRQRRFEAKS